ncbi:hypothetical protein [Elstera sp.]|jgi:hypothetical protein|uniref:hypothetical protein n=1 Tax=Elstera sp. TaxID=1916664 RepID=UPI0037BE76A6
MSAADFVDRIDDDDLLRMVSHALKVSEEAYCSTLPSCETGNTEPAIAAERAAGAAAVRASLKQIYADFTLMDLATYRRLTRVTYSKDAFWPSFADQADEETDVADLVALAETKGLKAHIHVFEPSEEHFHEDDSLQSPHIAAIAREAQDDFGDTYPNATLVGCWPLDDGDFIVVWVEPLAETAGAA